MRVLRGLVCAVLITGAIDGAGQDTVNSASELARVSHELEETRSELAESRRQIDELRRSLEELRNQVLANHPLDKTGTEPTAAEADKDVTFVASKVQELHQSKVESESKYPVRLSGLILLNGYYNNGSPDIADLPSLAFPNTPFTPSGGIGGTLRQTMIGLEVTGPKFLGAQTSGDLSIDFAGGSPTTAYGITAGLLRMRTANARLSWAKTALNIGQDVPFFSPLSPTSYATLQEPAFSWSGNLWVWTPQVELEHRLALGKDSALVLQGGLLDPLTEEIPPFQGRVATAAEITRVPAIAGRVGWDRSSADRLPFSVGFGGYRARQRHDSFAEINSWTMNADVKVPATSYAEVSGEWYRGQAVGGLGGGIWSSVIYPEATEPHSGIHPLRSTGGWAQLKLKPYRLFEINTAMGQDENYGEDLRFFSSPFSVYGFPALKKNRTEFVNFIYKPNSILLFALEYRHLLTAPALGSRSTEGHINVAAGIRF